MCDKCLGRYCCASESNAIVLLYSLNLALFTLVNLSWLIYFFGMHHLPISESTICVIVVKFQQALMIHSVVCGQENWKISEFNWEDFAIAQCASGKLDLEFLLWLHDCVEFEGNLPPLSVNWFLIAFLLYNQWLFRTRVRQLLWIKSSVWFGHFRLVPQTPFKMLLYS